jgi:hypothetical protein
MAISTFFFASKYCEFGAFLCKIHAAFSFGLQVVKFCQKKQKKKFKTEIYQNDILNYSMKIWEHWNKGIEP